MSPFKLQFVLLGCLFFQQLALISSEAEPQYTYSQPQQSATNPVTKGFFKLPAEYQQKAYNNYPSGNGRKKVFNLHVRFPVCLPF